jgi:hypothetical protein
VTISVEIKPQSIVSRLFNMAGRPITQYCEVVRAQYSDDGRLMVTLRRSGCEQTLPLITWEEWDEIDAAVRGLREATKPKEG